MGHFNFAEKRVYKAWISCGGPSKLPASKEKYPCTGDFRDEECQRCVGHKLDMTYQEFDKKFFDKGRNYDMKFVDGDADAAKAYILCSSHGLELQHKTK